MTASRQRFSQEFKDELCQEVISTSKSIKDVATAYGVGADQNPVKPEQIRGEVWYSIPYLGWVSTYVGGDNRVWLVPVIAGGLVLYAGYAVASSITTASKRKREGRGSRATAIDDPNDRSSTLS